MKIELKSNYVSIKNTSHGDRCKILNEGVKDRKLSQFKNLDGTDKHDDIVIFKVEHKGKPTEFTAWEKYLKVLVEAFGDESTNWINKEFEIMHVSGKMEIRAIQ